MEPGLQARLLRVLEDGRVRRLGDTREIAVDVRVVAATHQDLGSAVREKRFREDLYYRLARLVIDVPPLRERAGDVPLLAAHFVELACRQHRMRPKGLAPEALACLERHAWPGNVRELKHACERAVVFGGDPITASDLALGAARARASSASVLRLEAVESLQPQGPEGALRAGVHPARARAGGVEPLGVGAAGSASSARTCTPSSRRSASRGLAERGTVPDDRVVRSGDSRVWAVRSIDVKPGFA